MCFIFLVLFMPNTFVSTMTSGNAVQFSAFTHHILTCVAILGCGRQLWRLLVNCGETPATSYVQFDFIFVFENQSLPCSSRTLQYPPFSVNNSEMLTTVIRHTVKYSWSQIDEQTMKITEFAVHSTHTRQSSSINSYEIRSHTRLCWMFAE